MKRRSLVSDVLKRHGIEAVPDDREVNCLSRRRFEEDMEDDIKEKAEEWAEARFDYSDYKYAGFNLDYPIEGYVVGYEAGYAEGFEVAKRQKEEE